MRRTNTWPIIIPIPSKYKLFRATVHTDGACKCKLGLAATHSFLAKIFIQKPVVQQARVLIRHRYLPCYISISIEDFVAFRIFWSEKRYFSQIKSAKIYFSGASSAQWTFMIVYKKTSFDNNFINFKGAYIPTELKGNERCLELMEVVLQHQP